MFILSPPLFPSEPARGCPARYKSCLHQDGVGAKEGGGKQPNFSDKEMVLGLHTMGQGGRQFTPEELAAAKGWALKLCEALARAEATLWAEEVAKAEAEVEVVVTFAEVVAKARAEAQAQAEAAIAKLPESMLPELRDYEAKKLVSGVVAGVFSCPFEYFVFYFVLMLQN